MDLPEDATVGLLFSGQGSQKAAMGEAWQHTPAWELVAVMSDASGHDLADLLLRADDETLRRTDRAQIATFALEMVIHTSFAANSTRSTERPTPDVVAMAGHSLGEYAALTASGILDLDDATRLVAARGAAMLAAAEATPGTMVAVIGAPAEEVVRALEPLQASGTSAWVANLNSPDQTVVAGDHAGVERASDALRPFGKVVALPVGGAFHSPLMAPAEAALRAALNATTFASGTVPVVANVDACAHRGGPEWQDLLARQLTAPVRWTESVRALLDECGCRAFIEIGPGTTLSNLVKRIARGTPTARVDLP
jgi:[acyl-carrier-protein] S-malonyltransferase